MIFPHLFSPFTLGAVEIRNRIFTTGHDTYLPRAGVPTDELIAYQVARARGGAGLIIIQVVGVHETARYTDAVLMGTDDECIPHFARLIQAIKAEGCRVFVQLFHPGRELLGRPEGVLQPAYAPSASPSERFRVAPRAMSTDMIGEIVAGFGSTARRMVEAGADGVEIVASHGYLPAQFMSDKINCREDEYGGSFENRLRFTREAIRACRDVLPPESIVGMRYSTFESDTDGLYEAESLDICRALSVDLDYLNVIAGTSFSASGAVHIAPPMNIDNAYLAKPAGHLKAAVDCAVLVAGRINQPQQAEAILAADQADLCGMTRAMICDPEMPNKARGQAADRIRACIGCNQACIGHFQLGLPISCIQRPETGRELDYGRLDPAPVPRKVLVVGGGVGGMKAAVTASARGHHVTLCEAHKRLGGQALLAQMLPGRAEFGGIVTNLESELEHSSVDVRLNTAVTRELVQEGGYEAVFVATGSRPTFPAFENSGTLRVLNAAEYLRDKPEVGRRVVIYDWPGEWTGVGIAEMLARDGCVVRLAVNGPMAAAAIQNYLRDQAAARLHELGVEVHPYLRLFGVDDDTVFFLHTAAQTAVEMDGVDTLIVDWPNLPVDELYTDLHDLDLDTYLVGDALSPRTCEEAVYEGLKAGVSV